MLIRSGAGTRALNDEASGDPEHSLVPEYCEEMFKSADAHKRGSPPWRGTGEEPWEVDLEEVEDSAAPPMVNQVEDGLEGTAYDEGQESALKQSSGYDTAAPSMEDLETLRPYE